MSQWIKVEDELPELFVDILACCIDEAGMTYKIGTRYISVDLLVKWNDNHDTCFRTDRFFGKVTHWMPLPNFPEDL